MITLWKPALPFELLAGSSVPFWSSPQALEDEFNARSLLAGKRPSSLSYCSQARNDNCYPKFNDYDVCVFVSVHLYTVRNRVSFASVRNIWFGRDD